MAKTTKVHVEFGVSQAKGPNAWLKATAGIEIEMETEQDQKDKDLIWEGAWERVTDEAYKQLSKFDS